MASHLAWEDPSSVEPDVITMQFQPLPHYSLIECIHIKPPTVRSLTLRSLLITSRKTCAFVRKLMINLGFCPRRWRADTFLMVGFVCFYHSLTLMNAWRCDGFRCFLKTSFLSNSQRDVKDLRDWIWMWFWALILGLNIQRGHLYNLKEMAICFDIFISVYHMIQWDVYLPKNATRKIPCTWGVKI